MSLKKKMTLMFSALMTIIVVTISLTAYFYVKNGLQVQIEERVKSTVNGTGGKLNDWIFNKATILKTKIVGINELTTDGVATFPMVSGFKKVDEDISDIYFGKADGILIDGSGWVQTPDFDPRSRGWYKEAMTAGGSIIGDPYIDAITGKLVITLAAPVKNNAGQLSGVLGEDILLDVILKQVEELHTFDNSFNFLLNAKGAIMAYPDKDVVNKNIKDVDKLKPLNEALNKAGVDGKNNGIITYTMDGKELLLVYEKIPSTQWILGVNIPTSVAYAQLNALRWIFVIGTILSLIIVFVITSLIAHKFTSPLQILSDHVGKIASGDFTTRTDISGNDEIGQLGSGVNKMRDELFLLIENIQKKSELVAASSEELTASAAQTAQAANQVAQSITNVAGGINRQTSSTDEVSGTVNEMAITIEKVVNDSEKVVGESTEVAKYTEQSSHDVDLMVKNMEDIESSVQNSTNVIMKLGSQSKKIGQITETISSIAAQTNLLALNAAIEAARAGEQGRGFAVVADEVRKLAEEVQQAAQKISEEIQTVQQDTESAVTIMTSGNQKVKSGVESVNVVGKNLKSIANLMQTSSTGIKGIHSSLEEIAISSEKLSRSIKAIDEIGKNNSTESHMVSAAAEEQLATMEEISSASRMLSQMAQEMQEAINVFRIR